MRKLLLPSAALALVALVAQAQLIPAVRLQLPPGAAKGDPDDDGPGEVVATDGGPPQPGGQPGGGGGPKESPRFTKLKALTFDRRPSAILKAWAPEPKPDPKKETAVKDPKEAELEKELKEFQKKVALGKWAEVRDYIKTLPDEEALVAYGQILTSLQRSSNMGGGQMLDRVPDDTQGIPQQLIAQLVPGAQQQAERHQFNVDDLLGLAAAVPAGTNLKYTEPRAALAGPGVVLSKAPKGMVEKEHLPAYSSIVREVIQGGVLPEVVVARFKEEAKKSKAGQPTPFNERQLAKLLINAGQPAYAGDFLPSFEQAQKDKDLEGLNLLSRHYLALHAKEAKAGNLEKAWHAVQANLTFPDGPREQFEESLLRSVELAPRVKDELGQAWLDESFTKKPERGQQILAAVGEMVAKGLSSKPFATDQRLDALKLMRTAVEALLKAAPKEEHVSKWRPTLTLLAAGWLKEADFSRQHDRSTEPRLRRDYYGNIYYGGDDEMGMNPYQMMRPDLPRPIPIIEVLRNRPNDTWVAAVDDSFRPRLAGLLAQLHLKTSEEQKAFPLIEQMAPHQPNEAKNLVKEFLRVWIKNHDPNANRNQYRYSWFFFAFEQRAEGIPLTRSKQERNLDELAGWMKRIKALPGAGDLDDETVVQAFTTCHSSAEVYKTEAIEKVFGPLGTLKPRTLSGLAEQMRTNLAGLWRDPGEQTKKKTNRKKKDIEAEVKRGYAVARDTVDDGLKKFPDHWALLAAKASLIHDEVNYEHELNKSPGFAGKRSEAFDLYRKAAEEYAKTAKTLPEDEQSNSVYNQWFAAALGAVDLGMITEEKVPDWRQPKLIKAAIEALPGELAKKHMDRFANDLFTRLSGAKPHVKFNYLKAGFEIVPEDHKQAAEARKVFDYYKDLVKEIRLITTVDGPREVGAGKTFGLFVNIHHTRDIERESGGFGRYLQNQNSSGYYYYNYGRPTADYRERFETAAKEALKEQFEVVSVTFQEEKVHSRALPEFGWRFTPYAYILLKPRTEAVDAVQPLRLDLDFLDTSGYVVLPIESPKLSIDANPKNAKPRPVRDVVVTQTLDERQAGKGILILEIKAAGEGLVPELADLCTVGSDGFEVVKTEDQGLGVKKFAEDADSNRVVSERVWTLTFKGQEGLKELPKTFRFAKVTLPSGQVKEVLHQRYNDADLAAVGEEVSLEQSYGQASRLWVWAVVGGGVLVLVLAGLTTWLTVGRKKPVAAGLALPADLNPFTVMEVLQKVRGSANLSPAERADLDRDVERIERHYFSDDPNGGPAPDLRAIATRWVTAAG
jgi:hypothetical protein